MVQSIASPHEPLVDSNGGKIIRLACASQVKNEPLENYRGREDEYPVTCVGSAAILYTEPVKHFRQSSLVVPAMYVSGTLKYCVVEEPDIFGEPLEINGKAFQRLTEERWQRVHRWMLEMRTRARMDALKAIFDKPKADRFLPEDYYRLLNRLILVYFVANELGLQGEKGWDVYPGLLDVESD